MGNVASQSVAPESSPADAPFVAADVGGTHARIGLVRASGKDGHVDVLDYHKYVCAEYEGLGAILRDFLDRHADTRVTHGALACAGYAIDGAVINDNLPWRVAVDELRDMLQLSRLSLINDFEAVAYATLYVDVSTTRVLTRVSTPSQAGPQIVVGPGTGLGSATILPAQPRALVLATEAGQIALAPRTARETEILGVLAREHSHVSYEHVLSGPGLLRLYRVLCELDGKPAELDSPERITHAAMHDRDTPARDTLDIFCALLGSFVGDLAMLYGASGGVWLAGGILPQIQDFLAQSAFIERFLDKGRMRAFLQRVPIRLMKHGQLGVIGAAGWHIDHQDEE